MSLQDFRRNHAAYADGAVKTNGVVKKKGTSFPAGPPKKRIYYTSPFVRGISNEEYAESMREQSLQ